MKQECTELFLRYRETARLIWNLGFWSIPQLREWDAVEVYTEAMARLFEGMVLLALGFQGRIEDKNRPGTVANFEVKINNSEAQLLVDKNRPDEPGHQWGNPIMQQRLETTVSQLRFVRFFDWNRLGPRDLQFVEVLIEAWHNRDDLVGHHALIEPQYCSIWLVSDTTTESPGVGR